MNTTRSDHRAKRPGLILLCAALLATSILAAQDIVIEPRAVFGYGGCDTLAMAPDGQHFLTAGRFGAFLWELDSGLVIARFQDTGKEQWYWRIAVSPDGKRVVGSAAYWEPGKSRAYVHLWDLTTGDLVHKLESPHWADAQYMYEPVCLAFCADSRQVAAVVGHRIAEDAEYVSHLHVWDADTGQLIHLLESPEPFGIRSISFSPDGIRIAAVSAAPHVWLWDAHTGEFLGNMGGPYTDGIEQVAFSPDGTLLATGSNQGVRLYDTLSGQLVAQFPAQSEVYCLQFTADGTLLLAQEGYRVVLWQVSTGQPLRTFPPSWPRPVMTPDGSRVITATDGSGLLRVWDAASGDLLSTFAEHGGNRPLAVSPDGTQLLIGSARHGVLLDTSLLQPVRILEWGIDQSPFPLDFRPRYAVCSLDMTRVVVAGALFDGWDFIRGVAMLFDGSTGQYLRAFEHNENDGRVAFSPDGSLLLTGGYLDDVQLWNVHTGENIRTFPQRNVSALAFSPDGTHFVTGAGGWDSTMVRLWNINSMIAVRTFGAGGRERVAFSPDGSQVLADCGPYGDDARVWDTGTGQLLHTLRANHNTRALAFSPDGSLIAIAGGSARGGEITLWDADTGQSLKSFLAHPHPEGFVSSLVFLPDGSGLISGGAEVKLWSLEPDVSLAIARAPGNRLVLTWSNPAGQQSYRLEQSSDLTAGGWTEVTLTEPDRYEITDPPFGTTFYRLRQP